MAQQKDERFAGLLREDTTLIKERRSIWKSVFFAA
jgi:hypothetical protein